VFTAFIALTIYSSSKRLGLILLAMSVLIGVSRVIGHIHSPIDIIGSLVFAFVGFIIATLATPYVLKRIHKASR
jgi:membrane-associated phospholipid phosphatase